MRGGVSQCLDGQRNHFADEDVRHAILKVLNVDHHAAYLRALQRVLQSRARLKVRRKYHLIRWLRPVRSLGHPYHLDILQTVGTHYTRRERQMFRGIIDFIKPNALLVAHSQDCH